MKRILVVDDEPQVTKALFRLFRRQYEVETANSGEEALKLVERSQPDVIISDFRMPGMNGAEFLARARERAPLSLRIILSAYGDFDSILKSVNEGEVCRFLKKPWDDDELLALVARLLESQALVATLYGPFAQRREGLSAAVAQDEGGVRLDVKLTGEPFAAEQALGIITKFVGSLEAGATRLIGGLLQRHQGRLSFVAEVGGDQRLTIEVPVAESRPSDGTAPKA